MNRSTARKSAAHQASEEHEEQDDKQRQGAAEGGALVQFAAQRAHGLADALHALATQGIDDAQRSLSQAGIDAAWRRTRPLIERAGHFVVTYPWRTGAIVALLVGAGLLTRTPVPRRG